MMFSLILKFRSADDYTKLFIILATEAVLGQSTPLRGLD